ncbi:MAG: LacI family transcriptional regulator [Clostridia bacterium]|nr:LacI family transcriptional regulator [Clostridia bacterium]
MTLKEIAAEARVSVSTVSRVLNKSGKSPAGKEVRNRILEIAQRTGYTPNAHARNLKMHSVPGNGNTCRSMACLFAQAADIGSGLARAVLVKGMEEEARVHDYSLKYSLSSLDGLLPPAFDMMANSNVDGIAIIGSSLGGTDSTGQCLRHLSQQTPRHIIYTGFEYLDAGLDQIVCDGQWAASDAADRLILSGHRQIAYIGGRGYSIPFLGYCASLKEHGIPCRESCVKLVPISMEGGYRGAGELLKSGLSPTACLCSNDVIAIGAMRAIREFGLSVPGDISIISMDDINVGQYLDTTLTTIHLPLAEMGRMTAKILIDRIEGGHHLPMKIVLPYHMVERESCVSPHAHSSAIP